MVKIGFHISPDLFQYAVLKMSSKNKTLYHDLFLYNQEINIIQKIYNVNDNVNMLQFTCRGKDIFEDSNIVNHVTAIDKRLATTNQN